MLVQTPARCDVWRRTDDLDGELCEDGGDTQFHSHHDSIAECETHIDEKEEQVVVKQISSTVCYKCMIQRVGEHV